jgi:hypothetical protein
MKAPARLAVVLWAVLAVAVFSVTFDWQTRVAAWQFMGQQAERRAQGLPLDTIENGFRPKVRSAARQSSVWLLLILTGGGAATLLLARSATLSERERFRSRESKGA